MAKKLTPLNDHVVVKPTPGEEKTRSGIVLPESAKEKPQEGTIVAVGSGKYSDNGQKLPLELKVGDKVIYSKYGGHEIKIEGEEYVVLRADDVFLVIG